MDYETVIPEQPAVREQPYWLEHQMNLGWEKGEITEIRLTLCGDFIVNDQILVSVDDFIGDSSTKHFYMVLKDFNDEEVDIQVAYSEDLEYNPSRVSGYYYVDQELSDKLRPGSYHLFVYLRNTLPEVNEEVPERTILNMLLTDPDGIDITVS